MIFPGTTGRAHAWRSSGCSRTAQQSPRPTTFTAGVAALSPLPGDDAAVMWEQADAALYEGKRRGGARVTVFDDVAELLSSSRRARSVRCGRCSTSRDVQIAFQPILLLREDGILGFEALARPSEDYGFDGPLDAFAVAEKIGRAHDLDSICRSAALARADEMPEGALLFLNVHPQTLDHECRRRSPRSRRPRRRTRAGARRARGDRAARRPACAGVAGAMRLSARIRARARRRRLRQRRPRDAAGALRGLRQGRPVRHRLRRRGPQAQACSSRSSRMPGAQAPL